MLFINMLKLKILLEEFIANQSLVNQLQQYANATDVFVSYRDTPQIGINPNPEYSTPSGIYAYPIKCLLQLLAGNKFSFALNKQYVYVFKYNAELVDIAEANTEVALAEGLFNKIVEKNFLQKKDIINHVEYRKIAQVLQNASPKQASGSGLNSINFQLSSGKNISDVGKKVLNRLLAQDVFNLKPLVNLESSLSDVSFSNLNLDDLTREKLVQNYLFLQTMDSFINKTKSPEKFGFLLWTMTRLLSEKNKNKWRMLFLDMGIYGVIDSGAGIIHPAEPCQVVFFSEKPIQVIETIHNT